MMRIFLLILLLGCLAVTGGLHALAAEDEKEPVVSTETAAEKPAPPAKRSPRPARKPAATFTPTEKIGADSAVSFPVDI